LLLPAVAFPLLPATVSRRYFPLPACLFVGRALGGLRPAGVPLQSSTIRRIAELLDVNPDAELLQLVAGLCP